jgi:FtsZ-binding cell division protein ZapB
MNDNIEELKDEIEKLKAKNYEIVGEKRKAKADGEAATAELEQAQKERDEAKAELRRVTVDLPRQNMLEEIAMPNMADTLLREITHHYDIGEGDALLSRETGEPLQLEIPNKATGQNDLVPVKLDQDGINRIAENKLIPSIRAMIKGSGATGGGAAGAGKHMDATKTGNQSEAAQTRRFGLS